MNKILALCISLLCCLCCISCDDGRPHDNALVNGSFCFQASGGNLSDQLYASSDWKIQISTQTNFVRVSPSSGSASPDPINIIIVANVNNNTGSRTATLELVIGGEVKTYVIFQDGTLNQTCAP